MTTAMQSYAGITKEFASDFTEQPDSKDVERCLRSAVRAVCKEMPLIMFDKVAHDYRADGVYTLAHDGYEFVSVIAFLIGIGEGDAECLYDATGADLVRVAKEGDDETQICLREDNNIPQDSHLYFSYKCAPKGDSTEFPRIIYVKHWELIRLALFVEMPRFAWKPQGAPGEYHRMMFMEAIKRERAQKGGAIAAGGAAKPWIGGSEDFYDDIGDLYWGE